MNYDRLAASDGRLIVGPVDTAGHVDRLGFEAIRLGACPFTVRGVDLYDVAEVFLLDGWERSRSAVTALRALEVLRVPVHVVEPAGMPAG